MGIERGACWVRRWSPVLGFIVFLTGVVCLWHLLRVHEWLSSPRVLTAELSPIEPLKTPINLFDVTWRVQTWPGRELVETRSFPLSQIILAGGCLLAVLFAVMIARAHAARTQAANLQAVNRVLQKNLTIHQRTEKALAEALREQQDIMKAIPDILYTLDLAGCLVKWNMRMEVVTGFSVKDLTQRSLPTVFSQEDRASIAGAVKETLEKGRSEVKGHLLTKGGAAIPYQLVCAPLKDSQGQVIGVTGIGRDISERMVAERMKDEFLATVSHELRTPLTSIRASLGLLAGGEMGTLCEKGQRMIGIAVTNADRLVRLINDILDIEGMASGKVTMQKQHCDAAVLLGQAAEAMQTLAGKAAITLSVAPVAAQLWADPERILQALRHLLSNALKFSAPGTTVWMMAEHQGDRVLLQIKDQGRGIPADKLHCIFERFRQVDASDTREKGGTGLGLAFCRSVVQQHGGHLWAESRLGQGSTFFFTLPVLKTQELQEHVSSFTRSPL